VILVVVAWSLAVWMWPPADRAGRPLWRVETVHDGDTVTCRDEAGQRWKIRLQGIDTPEHGQPFGDAARRLHRGLWADDRPVEPRQWRAERARDQGP